MAFKKPWNTQHFGNYSFGSFNTKDNQYGPFHGIRPGGPESAVNNIRLLSRQAPYMGQSQPVLGSRIKTTIARIRTRFGR